VEISAGLPVQVRANCLNQWTTATPYIPIQQTS